jgi:hypothetical protein
MNVNMLPDGLDQNDYSQSVSRCRVCQMNSTVMAVHSQRDTPPRCPHGWANLWNGTSFLMHSVGSHGGGQQLMSPGSCMNKLVDGEPIYDHPFLECGSHGTCQYWSNAYTFWLVNSNTSSWREVYGTPHPPNTGTAGACAVCQYVPEPVRVNVNCQVPETDLVQCTGKSVPTCANQRRRRGRGGLFA